jgi:phosphoribosyl 1,2-cyclic phosphodiesterase
MFSLIIGGCSGSSAPFVSRPTFGHLTTSFGLLDKENRIGIVIDNGTGVQIVSQRMIDAGVERTWILQTHFHHDHIEGLHLNKLLFGNTVQAIVAPNLGGPDFGEIFAKHFNPHSWPVSPGTSDVRHNFQYFFPDEDLKIGGMEISTMLLNHPGGSVGYRFHFGIGADVVIATDNELVVGGKTDRIRRYAEFVQGADLLIADIQYTEVNYSGEDGIGDTKPVSRDGWGHSTPDMMALAAREKPGFPPVLITHHDPNRTDAGIFLFALDASRKMGSTVSIWPQGSELELH